MPSTQILQYLKAHGEKPDTEIADAVGMSLTQIQSILTELTAKREVMVCHAIRFIDGKKIEGMNYRLAGYIPKAKPGAKSKKQLTL